MTEESTGQEPWAAGSSGGGGDKPNPGLRGRGPGWVDVVALILAVLTLGVIVGVLVENFMGGG